MGNKRPGPQPQLLEALLDKIEADFILGKPSGERLPPERTLAKRYGASRGTLNAALEVLRSRKLLVRKIGKGTFVAEPEEDRWREFAGKALGMSFAQSVMALDDSFRASAVQHVIWQLRKTNLNLTLATRDWRLPGPDPAMQFASPDVLGIFLMEKHPPTVFRALSKLNKPIIALDHDATSQGAHSFCFDNFDAGALAARRLHKLGHRKMGVLSESPDKPEGRRDAAWSERRDGFESELLKLGGQQPEAFQLAVRSSETELRTLFQKAFRQPAAQRITALFLPDTSLSQPAKRIAAAEGLHVPRDLSIICCAHLNEDPETTAIRFDGGKIGGAAAARMLTTIRKQGSTKRRPLLIRIKGHYKAAETHARAPVK